MNGKVLTAATVAALSCLVSTVWAERPSEKASCEFPGGAYYKSNNTLYLESVNDENAKVQISEETKNCVNGYVNNGDFKELIEALMEKPIDELKERGVWIYCADMDGETFYNANLKGSVALVIGSEGKGVGRLVK
uniref:TrmH family RNA methyltransferase n=1 Tax=uncultured Fibrobacter sp. TaxID=261512 RepID=UPI00261F75C4